MGFLRIHCKSCGGYWDIYEGDDFNNPKYKKCPHCDNGIDGQDYYNTVLPAFGAMLDANKELYKTATGYNSALFTVDFIQGCKVVGDKVIEDDEDFGDDWTETENLTNSIDMLNDSVQQLTNALLTVDFIKKYS